MNAAVSREVGLSIGMARSLGDRRIDLPRQEDVSGSDAVDQNLQQIFQLLERCEAEVTARRERQRRDRFERQRVEAERLRQDQDEERRQDEERQQCEAEDARRQQAADEAFKELDAMLRTLEAERILITFDDADQCAVDDAVLIRFGLTPGAILSRDAQARLDIVADLQRAEIEPIGTYASANGDHIVHEDHGWTLSAKAPANLRRIADAWAHNPQLQRDFERASAMYRNAQAKPRAVLVSAPILTSAQPLIKPPTRRQTLILAGAQREALTARWKRNRRFDDVQIDSQPGAKIDEPQVPLPPTSTRQLFSDSGPGR